MMVLHTACARVRLCGEKQCAEARTRRFVQGQTNAAVVMIEEIRGKAQRKQRLKGEPDRQSTRWGMGAKEKKLVSPFR
jgi:hypothetical protein